MEDSKKIKVKNRAGGEVVYIIPEMGGLRRSFQPREEKEVPFEELKKLSWTPGGDTIIRDYLVIKDKQAIEELSLNLEPEYFYDKDEVIKLLQEKSLDEFLDCLDFAPDGVLDLIKQLSVTLPLNDMAKREAIMDKLGFDVTKAIEIFKESTKEEEKAEKARRAAAPSGKDSSPKEDGTPTRRVAVEEKE